jgi:hypothetical protein
MTDAATSSPAVEVIYTAPTGRRTSGRVHRAKCNHIPKGPVRLSPADAGADALRAATLATCCSVREADRDSAVAVALAAEASAAAEAAEAAEGAACAPAARPAALRDMVKALLREKPGESFTAYQIGKELGRSSGAVTNALAKLADLRIARLTCDAPRTYQFAEETSATT